MELSTAQFDQGVVAALGRAARVFLPGGAGRDRGGQPIQGRGDDRGTLGVEIAADVPAGPVLVPDQGQAALVVGGLLPFEEFLLVPRLGAFGIDAFG